VTMFAGVVRGHTRVCLGLKAQRGGSLVPKFVVWCRGSRLVQMVVDFQSQTMLFFRMRLRHGGRSGLLHDGNRYLMLCKRIRSS